MSCNRSCSSLGSISPASRRLRSRFSSVTSALICPWMSESVAMGRVFNARGDPASGSGGAIGQPADELEARPDLVDRPHLDVADSCGEADGADGVVVEVGLVAQLAGGLLR